MNGPFRVYVDSIFGKSATSPPKKDVSEPTTEPYLVIKASSYFAGFVRYGRARRMTLWTRERSGAFGFQKIDRPLAKAIIVAIGCGRIVRVRPRTTVAAPAPASAEMTDAEAWAWLATKDLDWHIRVSARRESPWCCTGDNAPSGYGATPCDAIRAARRASEGD